MAFDDVSQRYLASQSHGRCTRGTRRQPAEQAQLRPLVPGADGGSDHLATAVAVGRAALGVDTPGQCAGCRDHRLAAPDWRAFRDHLAGDQAAVGVQW